MKKTIFGVYCVMELKARLTLSFDSKLVSHPNLWTELLVFGSLANLETAKARTLLVMKEADTICIWFF